jgi:hypothetical protein
MVVIYIHSLMSLHGLMLNYLRTETTLPLHEPGGIIIFVYVDFWFFKREVCFLLHGKLVNSYGK